MNILYVSKLSWPWIGGVERHLKELVDKISAYEHTEITVLTVNDTYKFEDTRTGNIRVIKLPNIVHKLTGKTLLFSMPISLSFGFWLHKLSKEADIIHFHLPFPLADMCMLGWRPQGKVVITWHSDIVRQKRIMQFYRPFLNNFLRYKVHSILTTSPQMIENSPYLKAVAPKCHVVPLGIEAERFQHNETVQKFVETIQNKYPGRIVLYVGRYSYYKGIPYLIDAMKDVPGAVCLLVGDGEMREEIENKVKENKLEDRVFMIGAVSDQELLAHYYASTVFVLPSIAESEAYGLVQLEAMACGKPVVSTNLPTGVPFVNEDNKTGYVVTPKNSAELSNAIRKLVNSESTKFGDYAKQRVEDMFTLDKMTEAIYGHYLSLLR